MTILNPRQLQPLVCHLQFQAPVISSFYRDVSPARSLQIIRICVILLMIGLLNLTKNDCKWQMLAPNDLMTLTNILQISDDQIPQRRYFRSEMYHWMKTILYHLIQNVLMSVEYLCEWHSKMHRRMCFIYFLNIVIWDHVLWSSSTFCHQPIRTQLS